MAGVGQCWGQEEAGAGVERVGRWPGPGRVGGAVGRPRNVGSVAQRHFAGGGRGAAGGAGGGVVAEPWWFRVASALEEQHVCAWSPSAAARRAFVAKLGAALESIEGTRVCVLDGSKMTDLASVCGQVGLAAGLGSVAPRLGGPDGLLAALRRRPESAPGEGPVLKRRFFVWTEAQTLLRSDPAMLGRVVDAIAGVAAEDEFVGDDLLLIQRLVLVGTAAVDVYAEDPRGQLRRWWGPEGEPTAWGLITGRAGPSVVRWRIGAGAAV